MKDEIFCPICNGWMKWTKIKKKIANNEVEVEAYVCPVCKLEVGNIESAGKIQKILMKI